MSDMVDMIKEIVGLLKPKVKLDNLSLAIKFAYLLFFFVSLFVDSQITIRHCLCILGFHVTSSKFKKVGNY